MKKAVVSIILGTMILSSLSMSFANGVKANDAKAIEVENSLIFVTESSISYDDFMKSEKEYLKKIDSASDNKMRILYEEATKKWDDFYEIFDGFVDESRSKIKISASIGIGMDDSISFDDLKGESKIITDDDMKLLKKEFDESEGLYGTLPTFKDFMNEMSASLKPISLKDQKSIKALYDKIVFSEKEGKYDIIDNYWSQLYKILDGYEK